MNQVCIYQLSTVSIDLLYSTSATKKTPSLPKRIYLELYALKSIPDLQSTVNYNMAFLCICNLN